MGLIEEQKAVVALIRASIDAERSCHHDDAEAEHAAIHVLDRVFERVEERIEDAGRGWREMSRR